MKYDLTTREIFLYEEIGKTEDGFFGTAILQTALAKMGPGPITIRINSPGGSVYECWAMIELLKRHRGTITTTNDGIAASAASMLMLVGSVRTGSKESVVMVHNPWTVAVGDFEDIRTSADHLEIATINSANYYAERLGVSRSVVDDWLTKTSFFDANQALKHGFIQRITAPQVAVSKTPLRDAAEAKLRIIKAQQATWESRRKMESFYRDQGLQNKVTSVIHTAQSKSNSPLLAEAKLQILLRQIEAKRLPKRY